MITMEAYSSSSSSSTYLSQNLREAKGPKLPQQFNSSLHTVRKPPSKPWKKPVAPLPPTPPRIYKVDPINFRDLVQKLTGANEFQSQRLQSVAPPPLNVSNTQPLMFNRGITVIPQLHQSTSKAAPLNAVYQDLTSGTLEMKPQKISDSDQDAPFSLGMNLSPSSMSWCSFLSPGTLSSLEQRTVL
uniref:VQ domain-containing protein n=1 Tax=Fagus sylvatica TaxID=28930 RepID=A0A2N9FPV7_FAGSY